MNWYALFPLSALLINLALAYYIYSRNPKGKLNRLYSLTTLAIAIWALGDLLVFTAPTAERAFELSAIVTFGATLMVAILLHFFLAFTKNKFLSKKISYFVIYFPFVFFMTAKLTTDLITISMIPTYWGYQYVYGVIYPLLTFYVSLYALIGVVLSYRFYKKTKSLKEKTQAKLLALAIAIPLIGGTASQGVIYELFLRPVFKLQIMPLTTILTTITAIIIAYAIKKYGLMSITPAAAADTIIATMADSLIAVDLDLNIRLVNKATLDILGYEEKELITTSFSKVCKESILVKGDVVKRLEKEGFIKDIDTFYLSKNKENIPFNVSASLIKSYTGSIAGIVFVAKDIRELKNIIDTLNDKTKALEKTKSELDRKVDELERFNKIAIGRELKMIELKKRIKELEKK